MAAPSSTILMPSSSQSGCGLPLMLVNVSIGRGVVASGERPRRSGPRPSQDIFVRNKAPEDNFVARPRRSFQREPGLTEGQRLLSRHGPRFGKQINKIRFAPSITDGLAEGAGPRPSPTILYWVSSSDTKLSTATGRPPTIFWSRRGFYLHNGWAYVSIRRSL
jgi:hypothetical protein